MAGVPLEGPHPTHAGCQSSEAGLSLDPESVLCPTRDLPDGPQRRVRAGKIAVAQRTKGLAGVSRPGPWFVVQD
jgi:hypothetical protein